MRYFYLILTGCFILNSGCQNKSDSPHDKPAIESLSDFELEPGFKIELIASEPLLSDPVDMEIDENGKMYVVEMNGVPFNKSGVGQVKLMADTNGDGKMDKSSVFADSLILPSGVMRWKKGILVTDPPYVLYFEDTNDDGRADIKNVMLAGFDSTNLELNINNPNFGLDNWIYLPNGGNSKTEIHFTDNPAGPVLPDNANGRVVRFRPDTKELQSLSSNTQYGQSFDKWGNHLMVRNSNHIFQEVIAARYLNRNPDLLVSNSTKTLSDHSSEVFPTTVNPENQLLTDIGVFTAACGITANLGGAFPDPYSDNTVFVGEPAHNLIHVDRLTPEGASFKASRLQASKEFLTSHDPWFRPVNMYIGPDGALYVVDFYRQFIEGPEFMADEVVKSANLYAGTGQGRIYRISRTQAEPAEWTKGLTLGQATVEQLVEKLSSSNIWWRQNAQRLLVDRNDKQAIPLLIRMTQNSTSSEGRLHALWTLEGMHALGKESIINALNDTVTGIRENAIKLAELHLQTEPALQLQLFKLKTDPDPKVRFQLLCTLGFINSSEAISIREELLFKDINDPWIQIAALSAPSFDNLGLLNAVITNFKPNIPAYATLIERLSTTIAASLSPKIVNQLLIRATATDVVHVAWKDAILKGLEKGIQSRKSSPAEFASERNLLMHSALKHPSQSIRESSLHILRIIGIANDNKTDAAMAEARELAGNLKMSEQQRGNAINFLALQDPKKHVPFLTGLINPQEPLPVQLAALRTLNLVPDLTVNNYILMRWPTLTPEIRDAALNTFMSNSERVSLLLTAIEDGKIKATSIGWPRSVRLMAGRWPKKPEFAKGDSLLKERARKLLTRKDDKQKDLIREYQSALTLKGDPIPGKDLFIKNCGNCHQIRGKIGVALGPDLGTVRNWSSADIMSNILDPNQSIADGYDSWEVVLNDGTLKQGIISTETPTAITIVNSGTLPATISRKDIKSISALGMSIMPVGLEKEVNKQDMANLLAFLRGR
ncbi:PVC-type heme-binding CxxCH protein [Flavitalea sp.]|nr:PVC-type heme-binding CxxCH protein [Flavitalea sp.]